MPAQKPTPRSEVPGTETFLLTSGSVGSNGLLVTPAEPLYHVAVGPAVPSGFFNCWVCFVSVSFTERSAVLRPSCEPGPLATEASPV